MSESNRKYLTKPINPCLLVYIPDAELHCYLSCIAGLGLCRQTREVAEWLKTNTVRTPSTEVHLLIVLTEDLMVRASYASLADRLGLIFTDVFKEAAEAGNTEAEMGLGLGKRLCEALRQAAAYCPEPTPAVAINSPAA